MMLMRRHGVPEHLAIALSVAAAAYRAFGSSGEVDLPLQDGSVLEFAGRALTVLYRPGHSPSDLILHDPARGIVLARRSSAVTDLLQPGDSRARWTRPPAEPPSVRMR